MKIHKGVAKTLISWEKEYKKGFIAYTILYFLNENDMYGYEISKRLNSFVKSDVQFEESGIYQNLKKLKSKNFVKSEIRDSHRGPYRKYYIITESGQSLLNAFTDKLIYPISKSLVEMIENDKREKKI